VLTAAGRQPLLPDSNARNLTIDRTGKWLLVASQDAEDGMVEVFAVGADGQLTRTQSVKAPMCADVAVF
jgi:6-phosphogluconolactonase